MLQLQIANEKKITQTNQLLQFQTNQYIDLKQAMKPNQKFLIIGCGGGSIFKLNIETMKKENLTFKGFSDKDIIKQVIISKSGYLVACSEQDAIVRFFNMETGNVEKSIQFANAVNRIALWNNDEYLIAGHYAGITIYDLVSNTVVANLKHHTSWVRGLLVIGTKLISICDSLTAIWSLNVKEPQPMNMQYALKNTCGNSICQLSSNIIATTCNSTLYCWNISTGVCCNVFENVISHCWALHFSQNSSTIIAACEDGKIVFWRVLLGNCTVQILQKDVIVNPFNSAIHRCKLFDSENKLVFGDQNGNIGIISVNTRTIITQLSGMNFNPIWAIDVYEKKSELNLSAQVTEFNTTLLDSIIYANRENIDCLNLSKNVLQKNNVMLTKSIPLLSKLTYLNLSECKINDDTAVVLSLQLSKVPALSDLIISYNEITISGLHPIFEGCSKLLQLSNFQFRGNTIAKEMNCQLAKVKINDNIGKLIVQELAVYYPQTTMLNFRDNDIGEETLKEIAKFNHWTVFALYGNPRVKCIQLATTLANTPKVNWLDISLNNLGDEIVIQVAKVLPKLPELTCFDCHANNIGKESIIALAENVKYLTKLVHFSIGHNTDFSDISAFKQLLIALSNNTIPLKHLYLQYTYFGDKGVYEIAEQLEKFQELIYLDISMNKISEVGANKLATKLGQAKKLKQLKYISEGTTQNVNVVTENLKQECAKQNIFLK